MKTVEIDGKVYKLEKWAKYIAKNGDGDWYQFEERPRILCEFGWYRGGVSKLIVHANNKWEDSLREV